MSNCEMVLGCRHHEMTPHYCPEAILRDPLADYGTYFSHFHECEPNIEIRIELMDEFEFYHTRLNPGTLCDEGATTQAHQQAFAKEIATFSPDFCRDQKADVCCNHN